MIEFIPIILKSSVCLTAFYLLFRYTLKKETFFTLNRILLISLVVLSIAIPFLHFPWPVNKEIQVNLFPTQNPIAIPEYNDIAFEVISSQKADPTITTQTSISYEQALIITYILGFFISLIVLLFNIGKIIFWLSKSKIYKKEGYKLALVPQTVSPMSFGKFIIMSKLDYRENRHEILKHELAHIKYRHTYDLLLLELVKIVHWFNPLIYALIRDLKELQEFQVDRKVIQSGIDSKAYQLLMIKKCVGSERYALANSFNHCQIKNRIVMMNNSKISKGKIWKVAIFLPAAALMLMAFGNKQEEVPIEQSVVEQSANVHVKKVWKESDFKKLTSTESKELREKDFFQGKSWHIILMNKKSEIMIDRKKVDFVHAEQIIKKQLSNAFEKIDINSDKYVFPYTYDIRRDIGTNEKKYLQLLNMIGNAFLEARNNLSQKLYSKDYESLSVKDKQIVESYIPINLYIAVPEHMSERNKSVIFINIRQNVILLNGEHIAVENLTPEIKKIEDIQNKTVNLKCTEDTRITLIDSIKQELRLAKISQVNYSSDIKK